MYLHTHVSVYPYVYVSLYVCVCEMYVCLPLSCPNSCFHGLFPALGPPLLSSLATRQGHGVVCPLEGVVL